MKGSNFIFNFMQLGIKCTTYKYKTTVVLFCYVIKIILFYEKLIWWLKRRHGNLAFWVVQIEYLYFCTSKSFTINGTIWLYDYTFRSQTGANNGWRWFKIVFDFISILILFDFELVHQLRHHILLYPVIPTNNRNKKDI